MNEHLVNFATALGAGDRAALQSLIPLASGLGAGTIFGLFFVGRRRAGFAVFESVAIGGAGFGALGALVDSRARRAARGAEQDRLAHLTGRGYTLAEAPLAVALPRLAGEPSVGGPTIDVWRRGDASFIDGPGAGRLRAMVDARWQSLAAGEARGAIGPTVLLEAEPPGGSRGAPAALRLSILRPGTEHPRQPATLAANPDGLFDVSELVG